MPAHVRVAILSSPRSGNMWLRRLLVSLYDLEELSADTPAGVDWDRLPPACALQLHWPPTERLLALLERGGFGTVVLARHPLDVLVSILQFAQNEARTARWLNGEAGNELALLGADPCSEAFRAYATGPRAHALLEVTPRWWRSPRLDSRVRYEDLVASPHGELERLLGELRLPPAGDVERALAETSLDALRAETGNGHFWRGRPGLWRELVPAGPAAEIAAAHADALAALGYEVDADPALTEETARDNWRRLTDRSEPPRRRLDRPAAGSALAAHLSLAATPDEELVDSVYRLLLRRGPDPRGRERALERLAAGTLSRSTLVHELASSPDGRRVRLLDDALAFARWARQADERPRELTAPADVPETLVGIPWALSRYRGEPEVLDVGFAFAEPAYLAALLALGAERLVGVDLAAGEVPGMEPVTADVRALPFPDRSFDVAFCLSTLQHVGCDNRAYGLDAEQDAEGPFRALRELRRVLRAGGTLLVTVPCGEEQDLGLFVQHTVDGWTRLFAAADFFLFEREVYELGPDGWSSSPDFSPDGVRYAERGAAASALLCAELRPGRLKHAARRSLGDARRRLRGESRPADG